MMRVFDALESVCNNALSRMHTFILSRRRGVSIGKGTRVFHRSAITSSGLGGVFIGDKCMIGRSRHRYHGGMPFYTAIWAEGKDSQVVVGDRCRVNGAYIHARKQITIGEGCVIASGVNIIDSNGHVVKSLDRTKGMDEPMPVTIGRNVWIGMNATILKGTTIGDNSIVGAGAVVKGTYGAGSVITAAAVEVGRLDLT